MKRLLLMLLVCGIVFSVLGVFGVTAEELDYQKVCFVVKRDGKVQSEYPTNANEMKELLSYITSYRYATSIGMYVSIVTATQETKIVAFLYEEWVMDHIDSLNDEIIVGGDLTIDEFYQLFPDETSKKEELTIDYLYQLLNDETISKVFVAHFTLPQDDDFGEPPASQTGDGAVYGVTVLGVAAAALAVLLLRKKKI